MFQIIDNYKQSISNFNNLIKLLKSDPNATEVLNKEEYKAILDKNDELKDERKKTIEQIKTQGEESKKKLEEIKKEEEQIKKKNEEILEKLDKSTKELKDLFKPFKTDYDSDEDDKEKNKKEDDQEQDKNKEEDQEQEKNKKEDDQEKNKKEDDQEQDNLEQTVLTYGELVKPFVYEIITFSENLSEEEEETFRSHSSNIISKFGKFMEYSKINLTDRKDLDMYSFIINLLYSFYGSHDGSRDKIYDTKYVEYLDDFISAFFFYQVYRFKITHKVKRVLTPEFIDTLFDNINPLLFGNRKLRKTIQQLEDETFYDNILVSFKSCDVWLSVSEIIILANNIIENLNIETWKEIQDKKEIKNKKEIEDKELKELFKPFRTDHDSDEDDKKEIEDKKEI